jgi:hypothetical protein
MTTEKVGWGTSGGIAAVNTTILRCCRQPEAGTGERKQAIDLKRSSARQTEWELVLLHDSRNLTNL